MIAQSCFVIPPFFVENKIVLADRTRQFPRFEFRKQGVGNVTFLTEWSDFGV